MCVVQIASVLCWEHRKRTKKKTAAKTNRNRKWTPWLHVHNGMLLLLVEHGVSRETTKNETVGNSILNSPFVKDLLRILLLIAFGRSRWRIRFHFFFYFHSLDGSIEFFPIFASAREPPVVLISGLCFFCWQRGNVPRFCKIIVEKFERCSIFSFPSGKTARWASMVPGMGEQWVEPVMMSIIPFE